jgi:cellulose synthase/poly-beta-1,6-N-acetylglucosamine synthase-like glycosyltransferase
LRTQTNPDIDSLPDVAVVIAARNEEKNLPNILQDLVNQNYDGKLNVYIADDRSTDSTWSLLDQFSKKHPQVHPVRISALSNQMTPKKHALTQCLKQATAEIILTTDADCRVGAGWVASAVSQMDEQTGILVGYVQVEAENIFAEYQALDYAGIVVSNAGMMNLGYAWSGSGGNLAYRRSAFTAIGGFNPVSHKVSGDDVYLVQTIPQKTGLKAKFNTDPAHFVRTVAVSSLKEFLSQRVRWSSNSKGLERNDPMFFIFLVSAFLANILILIGGFIVFGEWSFWLFVGLKFIYEGIVLLLGARKFGYWSLLKLYPLWFILQPIYIPYVGLMGLRGKFIWKPQS